MRLRHHCSIAIVTVVLILSCSKKKDETVAEEEFFGGPTVSANGYGAFDDINKYNGQATDGELAILLENSTLGCTTGQFLKFNGEVWTCSNAEFDSSIKPGTTSDACGASNVGHQRFNSNSNMTEVCQAVASSNTYAWIENGSRITSNLTLTVTSGSCSSLQSIIEGLHHYTIAVGNTVTLQIPDGTYNCSSPIQLVGHNLMPLNIFGNTSTPSNVTINFSSDRGIIVDGAKISQINGVRIVGTGGQAGAIGLLVTNAARAVIGNALEISGWNGTGGTAINVNSNSILTNYGWDAGNYAVISDSFNGLFASDNSTIFANYIQITGLGSTSGVGAQANTSSYIYADESDVSSFYNCLYSNLGSVIRSDLSTLDDCNHSASAERNSMIEISGTTMTNCDVSCAVAKMHSHIIAYTAAGPTITTAACDTGTIGYHAELGSYVLVEGATSSCATPYSPNKDSIATNDGSYVREKP